MTKMFATFEAKAAAELLGIDRHSLPLLRELGMLQGIKTGRSVRYSERELEEFWETYKGEDLSNAENIRFTAMKKRAAR